MPRHLQTTSQRTSAPLPSGDGGIFPPDVPVAVVTHVRGDLQLARPIAHPEGLGYVIVERPYLPPAIVAAPPPAAPAVTAP